MERKKYVPGRSNVIIRLPGKGSEQLSFVGSHLDVVPADPESWNVDPFKLTIDGDKLYGRGTTDCLGHVALMTTLFTQLSEIDGFELNTSLSCVFIASEEANGPGIGVDGLVENGELDHCKSGPVSSGGLCGFTAVHWYRRGDYLGFEVSRAQVSFGFAA